MAACVPAPSSPADRRRFRLVQVAVVCVSLAGLAVGLTWQWRLPRLLGIDEGRSHILRDIVVWQAVAVVTAFSVTRVHSRRIAGGLILLSLVLVPLAATSSNSQLSDDLYRYAWDGRIQASGIDPYRYAPLASELSSFRDDWLWPDAATCAHIGKRVIPGLDPQHACTRLNRPTVRTIYPPVAEGYFWLTHVVPGPQRDLQLQLDGAVLSAALAGLLAWGLRRTGRDPRAVGYYTFGPMAGINVVGDAHVDVLAALFGVGAVLVATLHPSRSGRAGVLVGLAIAVKLYPALLLPSLLRRSGGPRGAVKLAAAAAGVVIVGYVPHVLAVGSHVLGYLPGYLKEERYDTGTRFLFLDWIGLAGTTAKAVAAILIVVTLVAVAVASWREKISPAEGVLATFGVAFLVATPSEPWYALLLLCMVVLTGRLEWIAVVTAPYALYVQGILGAHPLTSARHGYGLAALLVVGITLARILRSRRQSRLFSTVDEPMRAPQRMPQ